MRMFTKGLIAALVISTTSLAAHAADTTITINGKVTAAACTINNNGAYTVTMPDVTAATLNPANSFGTWKAFDVALSNCPAGTSTVTATFDGTADSRDAAKYANTTGTGYATNVAVQVQNRSGTVADKGKNSTMTVNVDGSKNATFDLQARPYSTPGSATVGDINTVVLMNFTYN
ncbi:S-fimbrial adhesin protein SfaS precursor [compost metagenome]